MSQTTKAFSEVKLKVNFTAISSSTAMSNIASDDNISDTLAKIHHWYVKTNGFQASASPLVSTSSSGIVNALPSATGGFLKNTGTTGGTWTTIGSSDLPSGIVYNTGNLQLNGLFEPSGAGDGSQITTSSGNTNMAQLGRENYPFSNIYGVNIHAATKSDTVKPSLNISWYDASGNNNGDWKFEIEDNTSGLTLSENGNELFNFDTDGTFACESLSVTTINGKVVGNNPKFTDTVTTVTSDGSVGNAITNVTASNGQLTLSRGTFLTSHPTITTSTNTNNPQQAQVSQAYAPYFTAIDSITRDENGHVKTVNTATITLPRERLSSLSGAYGSDNKTWVTTLTSDRFGAQNPTTYTSTVPTASTSAYGITKLSNTYTSADASVAATQTAVNNVYKLANNFITGYVNNHLITIASKTPQLIWRDTENAFMGVFRFNFVTNNANVTINDVGVVFYKSTVTLSDEISTQSLPCELLKTDTSVAGVSVSTSSNTNKTFYAATAKFTEGVVSIYIRPWADYTFNGNSYTTYGDITRFDLTNANAIAGTYNSNDKDRYNPADIDATTSKPAKYITTGNLDNYVGYQPIVNSSTADNYQLGSFNFNETPSFLYGKNTTYIIAQGDSNGQIKVTPSSGSAYNVSVKGLGSAAYTASTAYATASHTHSEYIPMTGSSDVTGNLEITKSSGPVGFFAKRSDTDVRVYFGVGDGGTAEGIYSYTSGGWVFKNDGGNTSIPRITGKSITIGGITVPSSSGSFLVTGNTSYTATTTSSTSGSYTIGTLKIGGTDKTIYGKDTVYTHPSGFTAKTTAGFYKYTVNANGHVTAGAALAKSDITALGISASDHTHSNYLGAATTSSSYYGMADPDGTTTNWIRTTQQGIIPYESGSRESGHQSLGSSTWYFKHSYIDNMDTSYITIAGTLPYLRFSQTTSGSEYSNTNAGIKCYPSGSKDVGMNMVIQSGGNMIIGSGEFPTNFYNATKYAIENYADNNEKTYVGSDGGVYIVSVANTIANRNVFLFGEDFDLAVGARIGFTYGSNNSSTVHRLTSAATTTARTWTLPDKTGTIALTSNLSSYIPLTGSSAIAGNLIPSTSNMRNLGSSSLLWDEVYANFVNMNGICQSSGSTGGSITSYSSIVPNSTNYDLGSTNHKWGTIYVNNISDATSSSTYAVNQLVSTAGHSSMLGPLIPKSNSDARCTLGSSSYNWYAVYASNIYSNGYKVWDAGNSYVSFTCTSADTTKYKIDKQRCYCIFGKFVVINMAITTSTTFAVNTAYSIATIPSAYTAGSGYVVLGTGHYQIGSPVTPTVSAWVNGTSIKFSTTTANSTSSAKTIRVSFTYAMS